VNRQGARGHRSERLQRRRAEQLLAAAGSIVQVEARHAALIRLARGKAPAPDAFDRTLAKAAVLKAVKPFVKG
jgi:hypothetical protein